VHDRSRLYKNTRTLYLYTVLYRSLCWRIHFKDSSAIYNDLGCRWTLTSWFLRLAAVCEAALMWSPNTEAGRRHQRPLRSSDWDAAGLAGCHNDARVRSHNVIPRDAIMMSVMTDAPTNDHVAIWYSMRGRGVGSGVVVTNTNNKTLVYCITGSAEWF